MTHHPETMEKTRFTISKASLAKARELKETKQLFKNWMKESRNWRELLQPNAKMRSDSRRADMEVEEAQNRKVVACRKKELICEKMAVGALTAISAAAKARL